MVCRVHKLKMYQTREAGPCDMCNGQHEPYQDIFSFKVQKIVAFHFESRCSFFSHSEANSFFYKALLTSPAGNRALHNEILLLPVSNTGKCFSI